MSDSTFSVLMLTAIGVTLLAGGIAFNLGANFGIMAGTAILSGIGTGLVGTVLSRLLGER